MKINKQLLSWSIPALGLATVITLVAWKQGPRRAGTPNPSVQDTVPAPKSKATDSKDKDFDKELRQLESAREKLKDINWDEISESLESARFQLNNADIKRQVDDALKQVDMKKIQLDIDKAMKDIDFEKIQLQVDASLKDIDFKKLQQEINESMDKEDFKDLREDIDKAVKEGLSSIDAADIRKQLDAAKIDVTREMKKTDWNKELADLKELNSDKLQRDLEKAQVDFDKALKELKTEKGEWRKDLKGAWKDIDKAKAEIKGYQEMIYDMEAAGLLSTKGDYSVKFNNGDLFINDKAQSKVTADKYSKYFSHDKTTIRKENGKMDVDVD
ncbi:hypothetical protein [Paraflavitalea pollutisoli]|uniref:hypothetical protein n=1 Tax=Paraflavitalea pollutisoli TaxID=3034143 RepID=UPI0023EC3109|nr:hypothetical protein [Paraflavitalea sp. H1-2-19X]